MKMNAFLSACKDLHILVIGDLMVDRYIWGKTDRISPEAPVPVVEIQEEEIRLGGAANVALNLHSLGAKVSLCGMVGDDKMGSYVRNVSQKHAFNTDWVLTEPKRPTTVKTRIIANGQQVLRLDRENPKQAPYGLVQQVIDGLMPQLDQYQAIIFQDYDKGFLGPEMIRPALKSAAYKGIPTLVDPKFRHFFQFTSCTLFKPNRRELVQALQLKEEDIDSLSAALTYLQERMPHEISMLTLGEQGMIVLERGKKPKHLPAHSRSVADVSGAGDTVIAMLGLGIGQRMDPIQAAEIANLAGGLVCEEVGVVPIREQQLLAAVST